MPFTPDLIDEMEVLALFKHDSSQEGIKITSTASPPWSPLRSACMKRG